MDNDQLAGNEPLEQETSLPEAASGNTQQAEALDAEAAAEAESFDDLAPAQRNTSYTRARTPRRTQEAINDLAEDDNPVEYAHESNVAVGGALSGREYRRARSDMSKFQKSNRYGQYLEVPKGRRSIFAKRERARRRKSAIAAIVVVGILAIAAYVVWQVMSHLSFG